MYKIDINNIKKNTTEKIAYSTYERKRIMNRKKFKNCVLGLVFITLIICGTTTVNAMTNNSIVNGVKNIFHIKINEKDYNANCEKSEDGSLNCTMYDENGEKQFEIQSN